MKIHHHSVEVALQSLRSSLQGLSCGEAARRLLEFGPNRVERIQGVTLGHRFVKGFTHFFALILGVAAALAFLAEWFEPGGGMAMLGVAILGVILINGLFSFWQEYRAEKAIAALQRLLPHEVKTLRDGKVRQMPAEELVPGDVVLLEDGDNVPADGRLIEAFGVRVNNATVTGESEPMTRNEQPSTEEDLIHSGNVLLAGTSLVSGQAKALVFATGMRTEFGKIAHLTQAAPETLSPLQHEIIHLSHLVALLSVALGVVFFVIGQALGLSFWGNFLLAIGIIVANVPEGLLPTVTLALALGSQRMARRNVLIRHLPSVETLGSTTVICTDKTGTLTQNRMVVKKLFIGDRGYDLAQARQSTDLKETACPFFEAAFLCQTLKEAEQGGKKTFLGDPMEIALVEMVQQVLPELKACPPLDEVPFDGDRKRLSTIHRTPRGLVVYTKGAPETLLPLCRQQQLHGQPRPLIPSGLEQVLQAEEAMAEDGLRVLALAYRIVPEGYDREHLEEDLVLLGLVGLEDPPRPEVPEAIRKCKEAGIKVIMVTGDHPHTARAIARQIGLTETHDPVELTGEQLRHLSDIQLQLALDAPEILFARVSADQKTRIVRALQAKKHVVAVTGDGVNDAPALRQADIGIAMGGAGTDVAREASDMVLMDDNFASIVAAIEEGRAVFANIKKFLTYILTHNVAELVPYLGFVLFRIPLPLTVMQILAVDLGTDTLPALGLGAEKPDPQTMQRPPRPRAERLLNWGLLARAYLFLGPLEALAAMAAFFFVLGEGGWHYGQVLGWNDPLYLQATTACLSAIIVMQLVNVFMCRSERGSVFSAGIAGNKLILAGIAMAVGLILLIDYTLPGNLLFGTAPIPLRAWLVVLPFALLMLGLEEFRKWVVRRKAGLRAYDGPNELTSFHARESITVLASGKAVAVDIPLP
jgi:sodium/potassium-transporting ATPase subunit alpha